MWLVLEAPVNPSALTLPMGLAAQSPPPSKDRRWCSHLPLDVVLEQLLVHAVELSTADVVKVVGDVAGVLLGARAV